MAGRPLSLSAYRAIARRTPPAPVSRPHQRKPGELVWIHLGQPGDLAAVLDLAARLVHLRPGLQILLTTSGDMDEASGTDCEPWLVICALPDEHPDSVAAFLDHWRPDVCLWLAGKLRPNLVDETARRELPLHLVLAESDGFDGRRDRWLPDLVRHLLRSFSSASARSVTAAKKLESLGLEKDQIRVLPPLSPSGRTLPCADEDVDDLVQHLAARPVWLAANTRPDEWAHILTAHRQAMLSAHRLLLVLNPADEKGLKELLQRLDQYALTHTVWGDGVWPDETTQVLVADLPGELGLWYRIAGVSFLGSSLVPGHEGHNPLNAAALGTAILYGPNVPAHLDSYSRLANAGAARIVKDAQSLGAAITRLIEPDQAARMAHAGWDVATQSADVVDGIIDLVQTSLDGGPVSGMPDAVPAP